MEYESTAAKVGRNPEKKDDDDEEEDENPRPRGVLHLVESRERKEDRNEEKEDPVELFKKPASEIKTASKEEVPQEDEIAPDEEANIIRAISEEQAKAYPEYSLDEASNEEFPEIVARDMLEEAAETGDLDAAAEHAMAAIGATVEELKETERKVAAEVTLERDVAVETGAVEPAASVAAETEEAPEEEPDTPVEEVVFDRTAEQPLEEPEEDEAAASGAGGGGGAGHVPPSGPFPPSGAGSPAGPSGRAPIPILSGNLYQTPTPESPPAEIYDQGNPAVTALIGGIIGYLIGRRRGRIKAEKRLIPIQKKLEKQVEDLHWEVKRKELAVRRLAAEKVHQDQPLVIEKLAARQAAKADRRSPEKKPAERQAAPEARQLHVPHKAPEHLGHMLITAEAASPRRQKQETIRLSKPEASRYELPEHLRQRHVETLSRAELLSLSEKIIVDGTSLRQIYETNLIGERGLRRLVAEYLRGGEVKKILRREIIEREIDFERDPALRDLPADSSNSVKASTAPPNRSTLEKMVEQASAALGENQDALAYYKARAAYEAQEYQEEQNQRRLVDIGLVATITILAIVIIILLLTGR